MMNEKCRDFVWVKWRVNVSAKRGEDNLGENRSIQITLLANEGIILAFAGVKFLIDGLHEYQDGVFNGLSKPIWTDLLDGEKPLFQNIDYLLYTHRSMPANNTRTSRISAIC
jgi:hypothetical protein